MKHTLCHFQILSDNPDRLKEFYERLFGWTFEKSPDMEYYAIDTGGEPGGGLMKKPTPRAANTNYTKVESVDDYAKKIEELGGKVVVPKSSVPKMGYFAVGIDPEGNTVGLFEADPKAS